MGSPREAVAHQPDADRARGFLPLPSRRCAKRLAYDVGDLVSVAVEFDTAYRNGPMHPMPSWFRRPLSRNPKAAKAWDALIPSRKKEILRYFSWLKSPGARERNVARAIHVLSGRKGRFMARSW